MSENEKGYYIREFSNMTGLPQSKIRYYEKIGLFKVKRMKNGYRWFSPEDAFRVNAFRCLLQYGFSIEEAVRMLDEKQQTEQFEQSLKRQRYTLTHEKQLLEYRLQALDEAIGLLNMEPGSDFSVQDVPDKIYVYASNGAGLQRGGAGRGDHFPLCGAAVHFQLCAGDRDGAVQLRKTGAGPQLCLCHPGFGGVAAWNI